ncbi:hypothetical protein [Sphingopyxis flava]|uniref:hypothetical protein n=1 Tax=Sphingopyxis flava TaxID=1507287 RepID=UPI001591274A|nr:hypothetical protein [Sphingopyxis flava]
MSTARPASLGMVLVTMKGRYRLVAGAKGTGGQMDIATIAREYRSLPETGQLAA